MRATDEVGGFRRALDWAFRNRRTGRITVSQWPNVPLSLYVVATIALRVWQPAGRAGSITMVIADVAIVAWALAELFRGVNPFRRLLGLAVLAAVIIGLLLR